MDHSTSAVEIFLDVFAGSGAWRYKAGVETVIGATAGMQSPPEWMQKEEKMRHERVQESQQVKVGQKTRSLARGGEEVDRKVGRTSGGCSGAREAERQECSAEEGGDGQLGCLHR